MEQLVRTLVLSRVLTCQRTSTQTGKFRRRGCLQTWLPGWQLSAQCLSWPRWRQIHHSCTRARQQSSLHSMQV